VARLVLSPIGSNINIQPLHFATQVQTSPYKDVKEDAKMTSCPNQISLEADQLWQTATQPPTEAAEVSNTAENRSLVGHNVNRQTAFNNKDESTNHTKEKMKVGINDEEKYVLNNETTYSSTGEELPVENPEHKDINEEMDVRERDNAPEHDDEEKAEHEPHTVFGEEPTEQHDESGQTASKGLGEVGAVYNPDTGANNNSTKIGGPNEEPLKGIDDARTHDEEYAHEHVSKPPCQDSNMTHMKPTSSSIPMSQDHYTSHSNSACSYPDTSEMEATCPPTTRSFDHVDANMTCV
jgi:hypothetical protein